MIFDIANMSYQDSRKFIISAVTPRPIAWVSTIGENGVFNLAPYSFFCPISYNPVMLGFNANTKRDGQKKDTLRNIEFDKEYVINVVNEELAEQMMDHYDQRHNCDREGKVIGH